MAKQQHPLQRPPLHTIPGHRIALKNRRGCTAVAQHLAQQFALQWPILTAY
jgi:hypothetical protein